MTPAERYAACSQSARIATAALGLSGDEQEAGFRLAASAITFPVDDDPAIPPTWAEAASWEA